MLSEVKQTVNQKQGAEGHGSGKVLHFSVLTDSHHFGRLRTSRVQQIPYWERGLDEAIMKRGRCWKFGP
jgi:hypothetical protein